MFAEETRVGVICALGVKELVWSGSETVVVIEILVGLSDDCAGGFWSGR